MTRTFAPSDVNTRVPAVRPRSRHGARSGLPELGLSLLGLFTLGLAAPLALMVNLAAKPRCKAGISRGGHVLACTAAVLAAIGCLELCVCSTLALGLVQQRLGCCLRAARACRQAAHVEPEKEPHGMPRACPPSDARALPTQIASRP
jgi:hypothetical protein